MVECVAIRQSSWNASEALWNKSWPVEVVLQQGANVYQGAYTRASTQDHLSERQSPSPSKHPVLMFKLAILQLLEVPRSWGRLWTAAGITFFHQPCSFLAHCFVQLPRVFAPFHEHLRAALRVAIVLVAMRVCVSSAKACLCHMQTRLHISPHFENSTTTFTHMQATSRAQDPRKHHPSTPPTSNTTHDYRPTTPTSPPRCLTLTSKSSRN